MYSPIRILMLSRVSSDNFCRLIFQSDNRYYIKSGCYSVLRKYRINSTNRQEKSYLKYNFLSTLLKNEGLPT